MSDIAPPRFGVSADEVSYAFLNGSSGSPDSLSLDSTGVLAGSEGSGLLRASSRFINKVLDSDTPSLSGFSLALHSFLSRRKTEGLGL